MSSENLVTQNLQKMVAKHGQSFPNLYAHLSQLTDYLSSNNGKINKFKQFEKISEYIKKYSYAPKQPEYQNQIRTICQRQVSYPQWINRQQTIVHSAKKVKSAQNRLIQNFEQTQKLLTEVGIGYGVQEGYKINCVLQKIGQKYDVSQLRYWGKILTKNGDYHIIQGFAVKKNPDLVQADMEKYRQGANYYSFWVSHKSICDQWIELPLVTPQQMRISRKFKYIFTGDLNASINAYPKFPGCQRHLLKAQLVRITHNCQIAPKGLYTNLQQNPDEIEFAEEFKFPDFAELNNLQNWVHINPYILNIGRSSYYIDLKIPEEIRQEALAKLGQTDPKVQRLKGINQDKPVEKLGFQGCWISKITGNPQLFNNIGKQEGTTSCYGIISLKNPNWPGWLTVSNMKCFGSIYIGYGYKLTQPGFSPIGPEDLLLEGEDNDEFHEPNPRQPPDQLEPDSDDENKKPDE